MAKTVIAFANDAGGDLLIGIADEPREIVGLDEDMLMAIEEKISNIIFDRCYPGILPEIKFITYEDKHLIQGTIFRGSTPPYSLTGKDVKVAIYDDMLEITSPGLLPPSIDYSAMDSRQSDARNKLIAPVFKRLGIIDQWGNGLKLISDELKEYPNIELRWREVGLSFQVQFVKLDYTTELAEKQELRQELQQELQQEFEKRSLYSEVLQCLIHEVKSRQEISILLGQKKVSGQLNKIIQKLIEQQLIERTIPNTLNHPSQKFRITKRGVTFLELLKPDK
ncbi:MAG: ATP-binding protein [Bacteroidales bacterium]